MMYRSPAIPDSRIPRAADPAHQHLIDTYASETNKVVTVWRGFSPEDLDYRPHRRSGTVLEQMRHQLLSERRFFGEFLGIDEPTLSEALPGVQTVDSCIEKVRDLAVRRLDALASKDESWWRQNVPFFDVQRQRIWIFWRRLLHTAHHRAQLGVYLRLLDKPVPSTYGPTADATWVGADPSYGNDPTLRV